MPELPDVEVFRRHVARTALHRRLCGVEVRDAEVVRGVDAGRLRSVLTGAGLRSTRRHGKHLFVALDDADAGALELHFGMTGRALARPGEEPAPRHARVTLRFEDGGALDFVDQRKLGTVTVVDDVDERIADLGLGPDALGIDRSGLRSVLEAGRGGLKATLMDQARMAGLGNIYSDEVLFQARLDPRLPADEVSPNGLRRLDRQLARVLARAIEAHVRAEDMPRGWLIHVREDGAACPRGRGTVRRFTVAGRHAFWCPTCQQGGR